MASAMMSQVTAATLAGGLTALAPRSSRKHDNANSRVVAQDDDLASRAHEVRGQEGQREAIDESIKEITEGEILKSMESNESEQRSYFGAKPTSGFDQAMGFTPRPEIERRPETGDESFFSVFAFDGAAPEDINCRLAMLGMVWAFMAENASSLTVIKQLFSPTTSGLVYFLGAVQLLTYASLMPIMNGESTDSRSFGPFTARAERWNGRLVVTELVRQDPIFH